MSERFIPSYRHRTLIFCSSVGTSPICFVSCFVRLSFFARMQGATPGERMTTAVKTQAEKDKFGREAAGCWPRWYPSHRLRWLCGAAVERGRRRNREERGGRPLGSQRRCQPEDQPEGAFRPSELVDRARKHVNISRTVEQNKARLLAMYEKNRVRLSEPSTAERAAVTTNTASEAA